MAKIQSFKFTVYQSKVSSLHDIIVRCLPVMFYLSTMINCAELETIPLVRVLPTELVCCAKLKHARNSQRTCQSSKCLLEPPKEMKLSSSIVLNDIPDYAEVQLAFLVAKLVLPSQILVKFPKADSANSS